MRFLRVLGSYLVSAHAPSALAIVIAAGAWPGSVQAGPILQVASVTADTPVTLAIDINNMINQSNLQPGYASGLTDFDAYIASGPTDSNFQTTAVAFASGGSPVTIDMDLGGSFTIESLALWNRGTFTQGIENFSLAASDDATFAFSTSLGIFTATAVLGTLEETLPEVFEFAPTTAAFVRMIVTSSYGTNVSLGEVAFEEQAAPVPEPASVLLVGLGLAGLGVARRRRLTA